RRAASGTVEALSFFLLCLAAQEEGKREAGGDGEEAAPVAEPGAGGEAGAAQEDRRRHPRPGNIQAAPTSCIREERLNQPPLARPTPAPASCLCPSAELPVRLRPSGPGEQNSAPTRPEPSSSQQSRIAAGER
ncbi:hypothetical protein ZEAMMB73_Zm00001d012131, partial [Zea mays]